MLHVEDVLIPHGEHDQHGQDGAADEGDGLGDDCGHGGDEDVHVVSRWSVSSGQSGSQLVFQLIKMSEKGNCDYQSVWCNVTSWSSPQIIPPVQTPLPDTQTSRLSLDDLGVVEEAVEYLPEKDDGH